MILNLISLFHTFEYTHTSTISRILETSVPMAAPCTPMAGIPRSPKIKMALIVMLQSREHKYTTVATTTRSTLRII